MNLVFSENTGKYLNKNNDKTITSSDKQNIMELENNNEKALLNEQKE